MAYFDIRIDPGDHPSEYLVRSAVGQPPETTFFDIRSLNNSLEYIRAADGFFDLQRYDNECRKIGFALFESFFLGAIRERYQDYLGRLPELPGGDSGDPQVRLFLPDDLHGCPWELLRTELRLDASAVEDQQLYISRRGIVIRYVNKKDVTLRHVTTGIEPPLRLLYIFASPIGLEPLRQPTFPANSNILRVPRRLARSYEDFQNNIGGFTKGFLFHGHGQSIDKGQNVLIFEMTRGRPDPISAEDIGRETFNYRTELVILSACQTASFDSGMFAESAVGRLIIGGYPALVTAYQAKIQSWAGAAFVERFVGSLYRQTLVQSMRAGRNGILALYNPSADDMKTVPVQRASRDWWVPVVYATTRNPEIMFQKPEPVLQQLG